MNIMSIIAENLIGGVIAGLIGFFSAWGMICLKEYRNNCEG